MIDPQDTLRYRDSSGYRWRSGVIAFNSDGSKVLLVDRLILPCNEDDPPVTIAAGGIEPGETPREAAIREAHEEGGIIPIGPVRFLCWVHDHSLQYRTAMFAMQVGELLDGNYDDASFRKRYWVPTDAFYANPQKFVKTPVAGTVLPALRILFGHENNPVEQFSLLSKYRGTDLLEPAFPGPVFPVEKGNYEKSALAEVLQGSPGEQFESDSPSALHFDLFPSSLLREHLIQCAETQTDSVVVHHSDGLHAKVIDLCDGTSGSDEKVFLTLNDTVGYSISLSLSGIDYSLVPVLVPKMESSY